MAELRPLLLAALLATGASAAGAQDLSSQRDYSDPAQRDRPIACKPGDVEVHPGESLGQLFGADWPVQPAPATPDAYIKPHLLQRGPMRWPHGMDAQESLNVVAVLVDTDGKPVKVEILCSTRMGLDMMVRRAMLASTFSPAMLNGHPITSVLVAVQKFHAVRRPPAIPRH
jgi:hypothetical protein